MVFFHAPAEIGINNRFSCACVPAWRLMAPLPANSARPSPAGFDIAQGCFSPFLKEERAQGGEELVKIWESSYAW